MDRNLFVWMCDDIPWQNCAIHFRYGQSKVFTDHINIPEKTASGHPIPLKESANLFCAKMLVLLLRSMGNDVEECSLLALSKANRGSSELQIII